MVGWHHRLNGHEFEQAPGDGEGQTGKPGVLQSTGSQRVGHNGTTPTATQRVSILRCTRLPHLLSAHPRSGDRGFVQRGPGTRGPHRCWLLAHSLQLPPPRILPWEIQDPQG